PQSPLRFSIPSLHAALPICEPAGAAPGAGAEGVPRGAARGAGARARAPGRRPRRLQPGAGRRHRPAAGLAGLARGPGAGGAPALAAARAGAAARAARPGRVPAGASGAAGAGGAGPRHRALLVEQGHEAARARALAIAGGAAARHAHGRRCAGGDARRLRPQPATGADGGIAALAEMLDDCARSRQPVLMVVGVLGTTEYGSIDPLDRICDARDAAAGRGLGTAVHVDAAWGGYLASLFRDPDGNLRSRDEVAAGFQTFPSPGVHAAFAALSRCDSITVDPHKLGYL